MLAIVFGLFVSSCEDQYVEPVSGNNTVLTNGEDDEDPILIEEDDPTSGEDDEDPILIEDDDVTSNGEDDEDPILIEDD